MSPVLCFLRRLWRGSPPGVTALPVVVETLRLNATLDGLQAVLQKHAQEDDDDAESHG